MHHSLFSKYTALSSLHIFTYARNAQSFTSTCWNSTNTVLQSPSQEQSPSCSVQSLSCVQLFVTPWTAAHQASLSITNSRSLPRLMSIESVMPSNHLTLCRPLLSCPQSFPASGSFPMSQLFASGSQSTGVSASASVLPMNTQDWSPSGWTGWISLQSKGLSRVFSNTTVQKHQFFGAQLSLWSNSHIHTWLTGRAIALTRRTFVDKVMSLLFNMLSRLVITFLPRSKLFLNFMVAITICSDFGAQKNNVSHCFHCFPIYLPWSDGTRCHDLSFLNVEL